MVIFTLMVVSISFSAWLPISKDASASSLGEGVGLDSRLADSSNAVKADPASSSENFVMKSSVNGLTAEITQVDLNPDAPTVTVCANVPTIADWLPQFSAAYNGQSVGVIGWILLDPSNTAYQEQNRCYLVMLSNEQLGSKKISGTLILSLDYFETSIPERLPVELIAKAKERLKDSGIDFEVQDVSHGQNFIVTKKPDSYSDTDAFQKVTEALKDKVYGPWVFKIDLNQ
jgi:hypothetical protein